MCEVRSAPGKKDGTLSEFYGYGRDIYGSGTGTYAQRYDIREGSTLARNSFSPPFIVIRSLAGGAFFILDLTRQSRIFRVIFKHFCCIFRR